MNARGRRRLAAGSCVGVAGVLALASSALACTIVMGGVKVANPSNGSATTISRDGTIVYTNGGISGTKGQTVKISAWDLFANEAYAIWFIFPGATGIGANCHTADATSEKVVMRTPAGVKLSKVKTNGAGFFDRDPALAGNQPYKAVIPKDPRVVPGQAEICADQVRPPSNPWNDDSATHHVNITIL